LFSAAAIEDDALQAIEGVFSHFIISFTFHPKAGMGFYPRSWSALRERISSLTLMSSPSLPPISTAPRLSLVWSARVSLPRQLQHSKVVRPSVYQSCSCPRSTKLSPQRQSSTILSVQTTKRSESGPFRICPLPCSRNPRSSIYPSTLWIQDEADSTL
jgi:hypothetical protein